jgi:hypothetical protein
VYGATQVRLTEPTHQPADNSGRAELRDRHQRRRTRRALLTRLTQVGLLAAGLGFGAACDRLLGRAVRTPLVGWVANQSPAGSAQISALTQALIAGLGDYGFIPGQNLQMESRYPTDDSQNADMIDCTVRRSWSQPRWPDQLARTDER